MNKICVDGVFEIVLKFFLPLWGHRAKAVGFRYQLRLLKPQSSTFGVLLTTQSDSQRFIGLMHSFVYCANKNFDTGFQICCAHFPMEVCFFYSLLFSLPKQLLSAQQNFETPNICSVVIFFVVENDGNKQKWAKQEIMKFIGPLGR